MRHTPKHAKKASHSKVIKTIFLLTSLIIVFAAVLVISYFIDNSKSENTSSTFSASSNVFVPVESGELSSDSSESETISSSNCVISTPVIDSSKFSIEDGRIYYDSDDAVYGIDVSKFQGEIDWNKVADDRVDFAMIRAGLRGYAKPNIVEDPMCRTNITEALGAGIDVGLYFHSQAITIEEAKEEAQFILEIARSFNITYPLVIDWERASAADSRTKDIPGDDVTKLCAAFCEEIKSAGYIPAFYFNPNDSSSDLDADELSNYIFWMAQYDSAVPNLDYSFQIWQYSNTGSVSGIIGNVDLNICFYDFSSVGGAPND